MAEPDHAAVYRERNELEAKLDQQAVHLRTMLALDGRDLGDMVRQAGRDLVGDGNKALIRSALRSDIEVAARLYVRERTDEYFALLKRCVEDSMEVS